MQFMKQQKVLPDIQVEVTSHYLPEQSNPEDSRYVFAYHVTISNHGSQAAQLLSRHWIITDAHRQVQEVRGAGVIGEKPTIEPGASYDYYQWLCPGHGSGDHGGQLPDARRRWQPVRCGNTPLRAVLSADAPLMQLKQEGIPVEGVLSADAPLMG